jgi:cell division septation protein DedD
MPKLTDAQLVILSTATQRDDGTALPLPKSLKLQGGATNHVLKSLLNKGLLDERPAGHDAAAWRESKGGQRLTLVITDAGRQSIGVAAAEQNEPQPAPTAAPTTKRSQDHGRSPAGPKRSVKTKSKSKPKPRATVSRSSTGSGTKQALLVDLLRRKEGATIAEVVKATGWQPHSVRGAISGSLKKKLGLAVVSDKVGSRGRVYRITHKR